MIRLEACLSVLWAVPSFSVCLTNIGGHLLEIPYSSAFLLQDIHLLYNMYSVYGSQHRSARDSMNRWVTMAWNNCTAGRSRLRCTTIES
ncbi:hypothetical protein F4678DRAFT_449836 [Xylaria arbuscula]|nr:hypothetical protein F4678DRAFT_449836 [Xylaria arbuscula]